LVFVICLIIGIVGAAGGDWLALPLAVVFFMGAYWLSEYNVRDARSDRLAENGEDPAR
jgi:hypothetical protein